MSLRRIEQIQPREDLLQRKPKSISEEAWLHELDEIFKSHLDEALSSFSGAYGKTEARKRKTSLEKTSLATAKLIQLDRHSLLVEKAFPRDGGTLDLLTKARPEAITRAGLPATYRVSVPFERGRVSGELVSLSDGQEKALRAVFVVLEKHNYEGDRGSAPVDGQWNDIYSGSLPKRSFSLSEYYEARGVSPDGDGRFRGKAAELAKQDLLDLGKSIQIGPYQFDLGGGQTRTIKATGPLMSIWLLEVTDKEGGKWIRHEETVTVDPMPGLLSYIAQVEVTPHPLLLSGLGLDNQRENFVRIETDLHGRIKDYYQGKRYPQAVEHLATYLLTIDLEPFTIGKDKLAKQIGLGDALQQGRRKRVSRYLNESIEVSLHLGIIESYEETETQYTFRLSPNRGRREAKMKRQKALPSRSSKKGR